MRSRRAAASIGSLARRSDARNIVLSDPSGGAAAPSPPSPSSSPASIASRRSSTACSASSATTTVVPSQRCGTSESISASVRTVRSASDHSSRPNSVDAASSASTIANGPRICSSWSNSASTALLEHLRGDDLVAVPDVRQLGFGQCLGQLGALVEVPTGHVVVHLDHIGIVGIEVEGFAGCCAVLLRFGTGLLVDESHVRTLPPDAGHPKSCPWFPEPGPAGTSGSPNPGPREPPGPGNRVGQVESRNRSMRAYSSRWLTGSRKPCPSPS